LRTSSIFVKNSIFSVFSQYILIISIEIKNIALGINKLLEVAGNLWKNIKNYYLIILVSNLVCKIFRLSELKWNIIFIDWIKLWNFWLKIRSKTFWDKKKLVYSKFFSGLVFYAQLVSIFLKIRVKMSKTGQKRRFLPEKQLKMLYFSLELEILQFFCNADCKLIQLYNRLGKGI